MKVMRASHSTNILLYQILCITYLRLRGGSLMILVSSQS